MLQAVVQKYGIIIGVAGKGNWAKMAEEVELEKKKVYVETTVVSDATALPSFMELQAHYKCADDSED